MKRGSLVVIAIAAACGGGGGGGKTKPVGNHDDTPVAGGGDPWAAMKEGRTFTLTTGVADDPNDEVVTLTATVIRVEPSANGRAITLEWKEGGEPMAGAPPSAFVVGKDTVTFTAEGLTFPLARADKQPDGREVSIQSDGTVCYTSGPGDGAGECADVCFADFCVNPDRGLMGGAGTWWPNYVPFERHD